MRLLKKHPILGLANSYLIDSPQPANLSYMWNFGSLLGLCLIIQILTGVFLRMHYNPSVELAFVSVEHIMRDVNYGWLTIPTCKYSLIFLHFCLFPYWTRAILRVIQITPNSSMEYRCYYTGTYDENSLSWFYGQK